MYLLKQKGLNNNACAQQRTELYANKKLSVGVTATSETQRIILEIFRKCLR